MRVDGAFTGNAARLMRDAVWNALAATGIEQGQPATWTVERPTQLQHLKDHSIFQAVGGERLRAALDAVFEGQSYETPKNWGALFIAFPTTQEWGVPSSGWHIDAHYGGAFAPARGVKTHALLDDIAPRGGATLMLSGSHRLVYNWFKAHPPPPGTRSAEMRKLLQAHPYIAALQADGDPSARIARFMERAEEVEGVPLRVVENVGGAGDVILVHPLVLHVAAPNNSARPRFLLSGGVTTDQWGWAAPGVSK
jgi:hypothetical protein